LSKAGAKFQAFPLGFLSKIDSNLTTKSKKSTTQNPVRVKSIVANQK